MTEEPQERHFPLKNGGEIEGRRGLAAFQGLASLAEHEPQLFRALLAIVQGRLKDASSEAIAMLKEGGYLRTDTGAVRWDIPDVLLSAYQETPEGPVLVNPFRLESPEQTRELEGLEKDGNLWLLRYLREGRDDKGRPPTRG